ncbi:MAG: hypothetical protein KA052_00340 [Candidatus Pacebacteria bacterium]|nr:hypothetical protein [Candidatus Paceibacterota bacterium]
MPQSKNEQHINTPEAKKTKTAPQLVEQFLWEKGKKIPKQDVIHLVSKVMGYNINDGIRMFNFLGLKKTDLINCLRDGDFGTRQAELEKLVHEYLGTVKHKLKGEALEFYETTGRRVDLHKNWHKHSHISRYIPIPGKLIFKDTEAEAFGTLTDAYYEQAIKLKEKERTEKRKLVGEEIIDRRSKGERIGEQYIARIARAKSELEQTNAEIRQDTLKNQYSEEKERERHKKRYRPLDVVAGEERRIARTELKKEIEEIIGNELPISPKIEIIREDLGSMDKPLERIEAKFAEHISSTEDAFKNGLDSKNPPQVVFPIFQDWLSATPDMDDIYQKFYEYKNAIQGRTKQEELPGQKTVQQEAYLASSKNLSPLIKDTLEKTQIQLFGDRVFFRDFTQVYDEYGWKRGPYTYTGPIEKENGKLFWNARDASGDSFTEHEDGTKLQGGFYSGGSFPQTYGDQVFYNAWDKNFHSFTVTEDGKSIPPSQESTYKTIEEKDRRRSETSDTITFGKRKIKEKTVSYYSNSNDNQIAQQEYRKWRPEAKKEYFENGHKLFGSYSEVINISQSPADGHLVAMATSNDKQECFIVNEAGESVSGLSGRDNFFLSIEFSPEGKLYVTYLNEIEIDGKRKFLPYHVEGGSKIKFWNGKAYFTGYDSSTIIFDEEGQKLTEGYSDIMDYEFVGNKLIVVGKKLGQNEEISKDTYIIEHKKDFTRNWELERKLKLLLLLDNPELDQAKEFFLEDSLLSEYYHKKNDQIDGSYTFVQGAPPSQLAALSEHAIQNTNDGREINSIARDIARMIAPEAIPSSNRLRRWLTSFYDFSTSLFEKKNNEEGGDMGSSLESTDAALFEGGAFGEKKSSANERAEQLLFTLEKPIEETVLVSGLYGGYDKETGQWSKVQFPIHKDINEEESETVGVSLNKTKKIRKVSLPTPIDGTVRNGEVTTTVEEGEVSAPTEEDALGAHTFINKNKYENIKYEILKPKLREPLPEVSNELYGVFLQKFNNEHGNSLTESLAALPHEALSFLETIKDLSPDKKIMEIEEFVRINSFYDFDNNETLADKRNLSVAELFPYLKERAGELMAKGKNTEGKIFAGICNDFALLVIAMLRKSGIASGRLSGFRPTGDKVFQADAHGAAFALLPDDVGRTRAFLVDGTPGGVSGISTPSLKEIAEQVKESVKNLLEHSKKEIKDFVEEKEQEQKKEAEADTENPEKAKEIVAINEEDLTRDLNILLKHNAKPQHLAALHNLMNAFWYTDAKDAFKDEGIDGQLAWRKFLSNEMRRKDLPTTFLEKEAGTMMIEEIKDFAGKMIDAKYANNSHEAIDHIEKVASSLKNELNEDENLALGAIIKYYKIKNGIR